MSVDTPDRNDLDETNEPLVMHPSPSPRGGNNHRRDGKREVIPDADVFEECPGPLQEKKKKKKVL